MNLKHNHQEVGYVDEEEKWPLIISNAENKSFTYTIICMQVRSEYETAPAI